MGAAIAAAAIGAAGAGYAASQSGKGAAGGGAPGPRAAARSTAQGRDLYGGRTFAQDYEDALRYGGLNQQLQQMALFGNPGGTIQVPYRVQVKGGGFETRYRDLPAPKSPGMIELLRSAQPELQNLQRSGDPGGFALNDELVADARGLVGRGDNPLDEHDLVQAIRGGQAVRGQGYGTRDTLAELIGLDRGRDSRRMARGAYASGVLGGDRAFRGDPVSDSIRLLGAATQTQGGPAVRNTPWNPNVSQMQQNAYAANLSNYNSNLNNLAAAGAGLSQAGFGALRARNDPWMTPGAGAGGGGGNLPEWASGGGFY
jgi:hypothetical protein